MIGDTSQLLDCPTCHQPSLEVLPDSPPYVCRYCGVPSWVEPCDQSPPPSYCHESDHGERPYTFAYDAGSFAQQHGLAISANPFRPLTDERADWSSGWRDSARSAVAARGEV